MKKNRIAREKETVELMIRLYCRKKEKNTFFAPTAKNCCAMHTPVSTVARSVKKRVRARNVPYTATNLSCVNGCGKPCASPDRE